MSQTPQQPRTETRVEAPKPAPAVELSKRIRKIAAKVRKGEPLSPEEQVAWGNFLALYDRSKKPD